MDRRGFTLAEIMLSVAIMAIIAVVVARTNRMLAFESEKQRAQFLMQTEATRIFSYLKVELVKSGSGVLNSRTPADKSLFADLDADDSPSVIFFYRDDGLTAGAMDTGDHWKKISFNGGVITDEVYTGTGSWTNVKAGLAPAVLVSRRNYRMNDPSVVIDLLQFSYYDSAHTKTRRGFSASYVRANLILRKNKEVFKKNEWFFLKNVVYARST